MSHKILIVDDSETIRAQLKAVLVGAGFEVLEAMDGVEGLQAIQSRDDLIAVLCDINMPRLSGLEMVEQLKQSGRLHRLPVIMLTTEDQPGLVQRAKAAGARGWIVKPFKPEYIVATMKRVVDRQQKALTP